MREKKRFAFILKQKKPPKTKPHLILWHFLQIMFEVFWTKYLNVGWCKNTCYSIGQEKKKKTETFFCHKF